MAELAGRLFNIAVGGGGAAGDGKDDILHIQLPQRAVAAAAAGRSVTAAVGEETEANPRSLQLAASMTSCVLSSTQDLRRRRVCVCVCSQTLRSTLHCSILFRYQLPYHTSH